jgi:hypothetical protein
MSIQGKLTLRNYRCFDWDHPAVLEFGDGFTAFVGANNSEKSAALRAVYELRNMFSSVMQTIHPTSQFKANCQPLGVSDQAELANDSDPSKFQFTIEIPEECLSENGNDLNAIEMCMEYNVESSLLIAKSFKAGDHRGNVSPFDQKKIQSGNGTADGIRFSYQDISVVNFSKLQEFLANLQQSKYFPAFRNAINEGAGIYLTFQLEPL